MSQGTVLPDGMILWKEDKRQPSSLDTVRERSKLEKKVRDCKDEFCHFCFCFLILSHPFDRYV